MKYILLSAFFLISSICFSQNESTILVIPMNQNCIKLDRKTEKMLNYHNVNIDSVKKVLLNLSFNQLKLNFPDYSLLQLVNNKLYSETSDSLNILYQWDSFQLEKIKNSKGFQKIMLNNEERLPYKYYGRAISTNDMEELRKLQLQYKFMYVFIINKFETITKRPFADKTILCLHVEIFNNKLQKIFGTKSIWKCSITTKMYSSVFLYYVQKAFNEYYLLIKKYLKQK